MIKITPEERNKAKGLLNKAELPLGFFPFYIAYSFTEHPKGPFVIGYDDRTQAETTLSHVERKGGTGFVSEEYPYEVMHTWKLKKQ